jgi:hypothetical protein
LANRNFAFEERAFPALEMITPAAPAMCADVAVTRHDPKYVKSTSDLGVLSRRLAGDDVDGQGGFVVDGASGLVLEMVRLTTQGLRA